MTNHDEETKRKEIIEMAREAGFTDWWINPPEPERKGMCYEMLARLVEIAQAKERARHIHSATVPHVEGIGSAELMGLLENERKQSRKPLKDEQIHALLGIAFRERFEDKNDNFHVALCRAIERAHGINGDSQ